MAASRLFLVVTTIAVCSPILEPQFISLVGPSVRATEPTSSPLSPPSGFMSQHIHPWSEQSRLYRPPGGFGAPGMVSAAPNQNSAYYLPTFKRAPWTSVVVPDEAAKEPIRLERDYIVQRTIVPTRRKGTCTKFWTSFKGLFPGDKKKRAKKLHARTLPFMPHDRGKAYGYFPHPTVNRVQACTYLNDPWKGLYCTDDSQRPGNWPGSIERATLHPRPYNWSNLKIQFPLPVPHNVRLNPYLEHRCNGPHPIVFDITRGPNKIIHHIHTTTTSTTPLRPIHVTQPATYPPVTHMHIQGVAEDPLPHFPWTIEVANTQGITCGDVFDAIARKFLEHVSEDEYNSWTQHRRTVAARAYHQRVRSGPRVDPARPEEENERVRADDGLRRIDYMGERVIFHGLEQASAIMDDTWFMYLAASERSK